MLAAGDDVVLTVADDGRGLAEHVHESGLRNMRERAEAQGWLVAGGVGARPGHHAHLVGAGGVESGEPLTGVHWCGRTPGPEAPARP